MIAVAKLPLGHAVDSDPAEFYAQHDPLGKHALPPQSQLTPYPGHASVAQPSPDQHHESAKSQPGKSRYEIALPSEPGQFRRPRQVCHLNGIVGFQSLPLFHADFRRPFCHQTILSGKAIRDLILGAGMFLTRGTLDGLVHHHGSHDDSFLLVLLFLESLLDTQVEDKGSHENKSEPEPEPG